MQDLCLNKLMQDLCLTNTVHLLFNYNLLLNLIDIFVVINGGGGGNPMPIYPSIFGQISMGFDWHRLKNS